MCAQGAGPFDSLFVGERRTLQSAETPFQKAAGFKWQDFELPDLNLIRPKLMGKPATPIVGFCEPLGRVDVLRTRASAELRDRLEPRLEGVFNHHKLENVALSYGRFGASVRPTMSNSDFYTYGLRSGCRRQFKVECGQGGDAEAGATALPDYRAGFDHFFLKIPQEALNRKLAALLGSPIGAPLELRGEYDKSALASQFRFLCFVISVLDRSTDALPTLLLAEYGQALIVAYLCSNVSNYSDRLNAVGPSVAPWQVARAIDYIEANWEQPITVEALASATESSARSLFATFRKSRGCSPIAFVRHFRLLRAKEILFSAAPETSVNSVASRCGFQSPGRFAKNYSNLFGELPSDTLKRGKRGAR